MLTHARDDLHQDHRLVCELPGTPGGPSRPRVRDPEVRRRPWEAQRYVPIERDVEDEDRAARRALRDAARPSTGSTRTSSGALMRLRGMECRSTQWVRRRLHRAEARLADRTGRRHGWGCYASVERLGWVREVLQRPPGGIRESRRCRFQGDGGTEPSVRSNGTAVFEADPLSRLRARPSRCFWLPGGSGAERPAGQPRCGVCV